MWKNQIQVVALRVRWGSWKGEGIGHDSIGRGSTGGQDEDSPPQVKCGSCGRWFKSAYALFGHTATCFGPDPATASETAQECAEYDPLWLDDEMENIKSAHIEEQASLHFEEYIPKGSLQHARERTRQIMELQGEAIKAAIRDNRETGGSAEALDAVIDSIMSCINPHMSTKRMDGAQGQELWNAQQSYTVQPRRRVLPNGGIMYDLPIEETVQRQLYMDPVFAECFTTDWGDLPRAPDGEYHDIQDGSAAAEHPELGKQDYCGRSRTGWGFYQDALEFCDALGAARGKQKVDLCYAVCLNQPGYMRNELGYIFLVGVVLHSDQAHTDVGARQVINPPDGMSGTSFGASMRRLNRPEGVTFYVPTGAGGSSFEPRPFRGWLLLVIADALAAAELLGTKGSFGPKVKCFCWMCDAGSLKGYKQVGSFLPGNRGVHSERTQAIYDAQVARARSLTTSQKTYMQECGIAHFEPALKDIPHMKFIEYTPPDPMHCELKGNLDNHLYGFLYQAIHVHKWFTLAAFNAAVTRFRFCDRVQRVRPSALKGLKGKPNAKGSVIWTAGQLYAFTIHSLAFFRGFLPAEALVSQEWHAWAAHADYFTAMMKWSFTKASVYELDAKIRSAQTLFKAVKSYKSMWKPKNHFTQHMPRAITKLGPCRLFWCMRFEAKHQEFKRASRLCNFHHMPSHLAWFWARRTHLQLRRAKKKKCRESITPGLLLESEPFDPNVHSLLRLLLVRGHPQNAPPTPTGVSWLSSIAYFGQTILPGRWLLVACKARKAKYLVKVSSLFSVVGKPYAGKLHFVGNCFSPSATLRKDTDHMFFASTESIAGGGKELAFAFADSTITLLTAFQLPGSITFAESL